VKFQFLLLGALEFCRGQGKVRKKHKKWGNGQEGRFCGLGYVVATTPWQCAGGKTFVPEKCGHSCCSD